jgi:hypothetical protein
MSSGRSGSPNTVAYASSDMNRMEMNVIVTNVDSCSRLANLHQRRHRRMFSRVGSKTNPVPGTASSSPVTGLTSRGTYAPMPNPLSRIQLDWQRFWPPPAPANASAPSRNAITSSRSRRAWPPSPFTEPVNLD